MNKPKEPIKVNELRISLFSDGRTDYDIFGTSVINCQLLMILSDVVREQMYKELQNKSLNIIKV